MNKVVPWLKAHWPIPALSLVALAALPTAMYFAGNMHEKFKTSYQTSVTADYNSVTPTAAQIKYTLAAWDGSGNILETTGPANEEMIKAYKTILEELKAKVGVVSEKGLAFNKGEHKLVMEGIFPAPADPNAAQSLGRVFVSKYIDFHKAILASMRAGEPPKIEDLAKLLGDYSADQIARIKAESGREPNAEEQARIAKELLDLRLRTVGKRASDIGVYADASIFEGLPTSVPERAPTPAQQWDMQERSWINQDICRAVALANGPTKPVTQNPVKRVLKVSIKAPAWDVGTPAPQAYNPGEDKVTLNFSHSLTGRTSGPATSNKWYDVRNVAVEAVVSSKDLPRFLNALAATNFMTVLDLDIASVDALADLRAGFDYGEDHVVKVTLLIETVWLREWRKDTMPEDVRKALGMVEGVDATGTMTTPAPAPVNRPSGPGGRPGGGGGGGGGGRDGRGDDDIGGG